MIEAYLQVEKGNSKCHYSLGIATTNVVINKKLYLAIANVKGLTTRMRQDSENWKTYVTFLDENITPKQILTECAKMLRQSKDFKRLTVHRMTHDVENMLQRIQYMQKDIRSVSHLDNLISKGE